MAPAFKFNPTAAEFISSDFTRPKASSPALNPTAKMFVLLGSNQPRALSSAPQVTQTPRGSRNFCIIPTPRTPRGPPVLRSPQAPRQPRASQAKQGLRTSRSHRYDDSLLLALPFQHANKEDTVLHPLPRFGKNLYSPLNGGFSAAQPYGRNVRDEQVQSGPARSDVSSEPGKRSSKAPVRNQ